MFKHFADRAEAGRLLAAELLDLAGEDAVVLALPRGGVAVAREIALALGAPLDLLLVAKLGAPFQPELAIGAIVAGEPPFVHRNEDVIAALHVGEDYVEGEIAQKTAELERRRRIFFGEREPVSLAGRTVVVVDDGIATGATALAALRAVRAAGAARIVLAAPVAAAQSVATLAEDADSVVTVLAPDDLGAIGFYYRDFRQLGDADVLELLSFD